MGGSEGDEDKVKRAFSKVKLDVKFTTETLERSLNLGNFQKKQIEKLIDELIVIKERLSRIENELKDREKVKLDRKFEGSADI